MYSAGAVEIHGAVLGSFACQAKEARMDDERVRENAAESGSYREIARRAFWSFSCGLLIAGRGGQGALTR